MRKYLRFDEKKEKINTNYELMERKQTNKSSDHLINNPKKKLTGNYEKIRRIFHS